MGKSIDLTGQTFGRWFVIKRNDYRAKDGRRKYQCKCECGVVRDVDGRALTKGVSKSCGCLSKELVSQRSSTHSMTSSPTYKSWAAMKARCNLQSTSEWENYGGRGITYDPSWESFEGFYVDMGERPSGTTLDRIDVNGNYYRDNCRWSSNAVQSHGRRKLVYKNSSIVSKFIGVVWHSRSETWRVKLVYGGDVVIDKIGFTNEQDAARLYDKFSKIYYNDEPNKELLANIV